MRTVLTAVSLCAITYTGCRSWDMQIPSVLERARHFPWTPATSGCQAGCLHYRQTAQEEYIKVCFLYIHDGPHPYRPPAVHVHVPPFPLGQPLLQVDYVHVVLRVVVDVEAG